MEILLGIAIASLLVAAYIIHNLYAKLKYFEDNQETLIASQDALTKRVISSYAFLLKLFTTAKRDIDKVDKNGAFSSDDEVGFAFTTIKECIEHVKFQLEKINEAMKEE